MDRVRSGKSRDLNVRFLAMVGQYVFEPQFCSPAAGKKDRGRRVSRMHGIGLGHPSLTCCTSTKTPCSPLLEVALKAGIPSKSYVMNLLRRLLDDTLPAPSRVVLLGH